MDLNAARKVGVSVLATAAIAGTMLMAAAAPASATAPPKHQVTICHATDSVQNPYVEITVDIASSGYVKAGHADHTGPIPTSTQDVADFKAAGTKWGDVIPAYHYDPTNFDYPGLNWDADGMALLNNGCAISDQQPETVTYRLVRRMPLGVSKVTLKAGLVPSITCDTSTSGTLEYVVTFSDGTVQTMDVGVSRKGSILRVRSGGIVLAKVRASDIC
jgi:hypothetical protein